MARMSDKEKYQRSLDKKRASMEKANAKRLAKLKDPKEIAKRREKQNELNQRAFDRAKAKSEAKRLTPRATPAKAATPKKRPPIKSKGLKGRAPTASEKRMQDKMASLPCVCCGVLVRRGLIPAELLDNISQFNPVSLHHTDGRVKVGAHYRQLPLCACHHQVAIEADLRTSAPYMYLVPVHADGNWGGKAQFNALFGSEMKLLELVYEQIGESVFFSENILLSEVA